MSAVAETAKKTDAAQSPPPPSAEAAADDGFEVIDAGTGTQPVNNVPIASFIEQKKKWQGRVEQAKQNVQAKDAEIELLRLQVQQLSERQQKQAPKEADFETPEAYGKAMSEYVSDVAGRAVKELTKPKGGERQKPQLNDESMRSHYERAAKLKAKDFDEAENVVIETLGQSAASQIIEQFENSEVLMYALGKNPAKLAEVQELMQKNPVKAVVALTKYAAGLTLKARTPAPDPDRAEESSGGGGDLQRQLDALREKRSKGKATMREVLDFKREAEAKGIKLI